MAGLPAAYEFQLPVGWEAADPGPGTPDGMFVALCAATAGSGFTANLTLESGLRPDDESLSEIAARSADLLRGQSPDLEMLSRGELDDPAAPGFAQQVRMPAEVNGRSWTVVQAQVYISSRDPSGETAQTVVRAVLTCTTEQFATVIGDYDAFLQTLRFAEREEAADGDPGTVESTVDRGEGRL